MLCAEIKNGRYAIHTTHNICVDVDDLVIRKCLLRCCQVKSVSLLFTSKLKVDRMMVYLYVHGLLGKAYSELCAVAFPFYIHKLEVNIVTTTRLSLYVCNLLLFIFIQKNK